MNFCVLVLIFNNSVFSSKFNDRNGTSKSEANPFEEEEWDEGDGESVLVDNGEPGVPVKALYDYEGAESDELTFKQGKHNQSKIVWTFLKNFNDSNEKKTTIYLLFVGDIFEKLEDEDEQGWCKGRRNGKVGLYPANYVELIAT